MQTFGVNTGQSISVTDVKLQTCTECHLREQAGNHFHEAPKQTNHSLSKRFLQFTLPAADLALSAALMVVDPKLAALFTIRHHSGFYNLNNSDHTEGDRLVSCALVKNVFKVETLRTFESGATPRHL